MSSQHLIIRVESQSRLRFSPCSRVPVIVFLASHCPFILCGPSTLINVTRAAADGSADGPEDKVAGDAQIKETFDAKFSVLSPVILSPVVAVNCSVFSPRMQNISLLFLSRTLKHAQEDKRTRLDLGIL